MVVPLEMKLTKRNLLGLLIVVTCLFMPLSCISVLFVLNSINPMQQAFIAGFKVKNGTSEDILITPVGTWGKEGNKARLSTFLIRFPAIYSLYKGNYLLHPGETKKILFDWDSTNLSEIAIQTTEGKFFQFVINPKPTENQYYVPDKKMYIIPFINELDQM